IKMIENINYFKNLERIFKFFYPFMVKKEKGEVKDMESVIIQIYPKIEKYIFGPKQFPYLYKKESLVYSQKILIYGVNIHSFYNTYRLLDVEKLSLLENWAVIWMIYLSILVN